MLKINDDINIYFPLTMIPRNQQIYMLDFIKKSIINAKKYILINAPTGSGKSYLTLLFSNWYKNTINSDAKIDILTNSKILQDQYTSEFNVIKPLKGRNNYYCDPYDTDCSKGWDICNTSGPKCGSECPYTNAKETWKSSTIGLTNFHLFNTFSIYVKDNILDRNSNVLIIDEAHDFESVFCDFISTTISAKSLKQYGFNISEIEKLDNNIIRIKSVEQYISFLNNKFINKIKEKQEWIDKRKENAPQKIKLEYAKYSQHCLTQLEKFKYLINEYEQDKSNWILDITLNEKDKDFSKIVLDVKPVWGHKYIKDMIFKNYDHVIMMSGSILDKSMFSYINGISEKFTTYFDIDSDFKLKNRPIYYMSGVGKMTYSQKFNTFENQLVLIKKILKKHKKQKGIIHCGTYEIANWLKEHITDKRLLFHDSENRDEILKKHINSKSQTILVSPSMVSGVDLKDDISRFQIILKIPFPFLGSEKIKQRMKTNKHWYNWKTVVDFIQMYGRSIRSVDDYADTYVLDDSFSDLLRYNSDIIPRYISDAIKKVKVNI